MPIPPARSVGPTLPDMLDGLTALPDPFAPSFGDLLNRADAGELDDGVSLAPISLSLATTSAEPMPPEPLADNESEPAIQTEPAGLFAALHPMSAPPAMRPPAAAAGPVEPHFHRDSVAATRPLAAREPAPLSQPFAPAPMAPHPPAAMLMLPDQPIDPFAGSTSFADLRAAMALAAGQAAPAPIPADQAPPVARLRLIPLAILLGGDAPALQTSARERAQPADPSSASAASQGPSDVNASASPALISAAPPPSGAPPVSSSPLPAPSPTATALAQAIGRALPDLPGQAGGVELALDPAGLGLVRIHWQPDADAAPMIRIAADHPAAAQLLAREADGMARLIGADDDMVIAIRVDPPAEAHARHQNLGEPRDGAPVPRQPDAHLGGAGQHGQSAQQRQSQPAVRAIQSPPGAAVDSSAPEPRPGDGHRATPPGRYA